MRGLFLPLCVHIWLDFPLPGCPANPPSTTAWTGWPADQHRRSVEQWGTAVVVHVLQMCPLSLFLFARLKWLPGLQNWLCTHITAVWQGTGAVGHWARDTDTDTDTDTQTARADCRPSTPLLWLQSYLHYSLAKKVHKAALSTKKREGDFDWLNTEQWITGEKERVRLALR